jgi:hypothetical protein
MRVNFKTTSFFSARRTNRLAAAVASAFLVTAAIHPASAQVNHNSNDATISSPQMTTPCSPERKRKIDQAKAKIAQIQERIDGLKDKIAKRNQDMEKIQPGSSSKHWADFPDKSRLHDLAYSNSLNNMTIASLTTDLRIENVSMSNDGGCP